MRAPTEPRSPRHALLLGAAVPLGFSLFDLALFAGTDRPADALVLLPGMGWAVLTGVLVGAVLSYLPRLAPIAIAAFAVFAFRPDLLGSHTAAERALPAAVLLALVLWQAGMLVHARVSGVCPVALGLGLALLGTSGFFLIEGSGGAPWFAIVPALALLALAYPKPGKAIASLALLVLLGAAGLRGRQAMHTSRLPRPDRAASSNKIADSSRPSVILLVLDTVRADRMGMYGYERDTTPGLDAFADKYMTRFERAHSTSSWTIPSHASLFTGLVPAEHGVTHPRSKDPSAPHSTWGRPHRLAPETETLAHRLDAAGWRTGAVVANHMLGSWTGLDRGFEHFDDHGEAHLGSHQAFFQYSGRAALAGHLPYRDAHTITDLALAWLDRGDSKDEERPFFLFANYMDAHTPYAPPAPFSGLFGEERPADELRPRELELLPLLYDRELAYLDSEVSRLLRDLERHGRLDNTLLIVTSDHGEAFGEHGYWSHDWALFEEMIHVPLLIKPPAGREGVLSEVSLDGTDVHDLILEMLGVPGLERTADDPRPFAEWFFTASLGREKGVPGPPKEELERDLGAWHEGSIKWIVSSRGGVQAFDLARDPKEEAPLELSADETARALDRAHAWWTAHPSRAHSTERLDADILDELRDLGYAGQE